MLKPIAIDTSDHIELRRNGCVYVDKTAYFHRLATRLDTSRFFIARPRRFGKSLMIKTFKAHFEGRCELFDGLAMTGHLQDRLKCDESANAALEQVKAKCYDVPYRARNLPIWSDGLNFDRKSRQLPDAQAKKTE